MISCSALTGTLGERRRQFNALVSQAKLEATLQQPENSALDAIFKIQVASREKHLPFLLQALKSEDLLIVSTALRSDWLLQDDHADIINPLYLEDHLYPDMTTTAVNKMRHWIALKLRDKERCKEFYEHYAEKDYNVAFKFLCHCRDEYILANVAPLLHKLSPHRLKMLSESCPGVIQMFFDRFQSSEMVLMKYLEDRKSYFGVLKHFLKLRPDMVLDIMEKYFEIRNFDRLSSRATKYILTQHKNRFTNKPELYTAWMLNIKTLADSITRKEIVELLLQLARAEYIGDWFCYKNIEPLFKRLDITERNPLKQQIFVDKKLMGEKVKECPYELPKYPDVVLLSKGIFQDEKNYLFDDDYDDDFHDIMVDLCAGKPEMLFKSSWNKETELDRMFERYRFMGFEKTFHELRKKLTVETLETRQVMMLVLVSKTGGCSESIQKLITLLLERHRNEPVHLRATVLRSLVKRSCIWRVPQPIWDMCLQFGPDLGFDGTVPQAACVEAVHAVVLRSLVHKCDIGPAVWKAYLNKFSTFTEYQLDVQERDVVSTQLPGLLLTEVKAVPSEAALRLGQILDVLNAYKVSPNACPGVVDAIADAARSDDKVNFLLERLFTARVARKRLCELNFSMIQTDASYVNALKHNTDLLNSAKEFNALVESGELKLERFFKVLVLYFSEDNGLAEKYLSVLERNAFVNNEDSKKHLSRPIAMLAKNKYVKIYQKLKSRNEDIPSRNLAACLHANLHLVRPYLGFDVETAGTKVIANRWMKCSDRNLNSIIVKCLAHQRTQRLALVMSTRAGKEYDVYRTVAATRPRLALKCFLKHVQRQNSMDERVWDVILPAISGLNLLNTTTKRRLHKELCDLSNVPPTKAAKYYEAVFKACVSNSYDAWAMLMISKIITNLDEIDESFVIDLIKNYLSNNIKSTQDNYIIMGRQLDKKSRLYVRAIATFLILSKSEDTLKYRFEKVGQPLFDQLQFLWNAYVSDMSLSPMSESPRGPIFKLNQYLTLFLHSLKNTEAFLNPEYSQCLTLFEIVASCMRRFLPIELYFQRYVHLHLTMLYLKTIRQSVANNSEVFDNLFERVNDAVGIVGTIFGKYVASEANTLKSKYFDSVIQLYKVELQKYLRQYFSYVDDKRLFIGYVALGSLEGDIKEPLVAEHIYRKMRHEMDTSMAEKVLVSLKKNANQEVKFLLNSYLDVLH